jgi:hypothetical protein
VRRIGVFMPYAANDLTVIGLTSTDAALPHTESGSFAASLRAEQLDAEPYGRSRKQVYTLFRGSHRPTSLHGAPISALGAAYSSMCTECCERTLTSRSPRWRRGSWAPTAPRCIEGCCAGTFAFLIPIITAHGRGRPAVMF